MSRNKLTALGKKVSKYTGLETFLTPKDVIHVTCTSDEVTANCPVTQQPDWYDISVHYEPDRLCAESKTVKLFLQSFRNKGHFCEKLASIICHEFQKLLDPHSCRVEIIQKARGGVSIIATAFTTKSTK